MATERETILRGLIDSVSQRPQFSLAGRPKQVVLVAFTTPHGFSGTVTMDLAEWTDPNARWEKVIQAVMDLEGPFAATGAAGVEGE